ncbi:MAG: PaaI family thioesterase [Dehalococcoidia bacterium]
MSDHPTTVAPPSNWARLLGELFALNAFCPAFGVEVAVAEPERVILRTAGQTALCRQNTGQWVGEVLELLASLASGALLTSPGEAPGTFVAPYGATVRSTYHLRPSDSAWVEAEASWVRRGRTQAVVETVVRDAEGRELVRVISQHAAVPEPLAYSLEDLRKASMESRA